MRGSYCVYVPGRGGMTIDEVKPFSLRRNVSQAREEVWRSRGGVDAYTGKKRRGLEDENQNVDHVIEIQMVEHATFDTLNRNIELKNRMRDVINSSENLNVTSRAINQAKKGPFTAALNRLRKRDGSLREVSVEQLARSGRARWLVDSGVWSNIEKEIVESYDQVENTLSNQRLTRAQTKIIEESADQIHELLVKIKNF
jgi:hypothetical protein